MSYKQCGSGFFADVASKKCKLCSPTCKECTAENFCTKCSDQTKLPHSDGSCQDTAPVSCATTHFYDSKTLICTPCHEACDFATGCTGPLESQCKKCATGYKVLETIAGATVTYKCAKSCLPLSAEDSSTPPVCTLCPIHTTNTVYDFSTRKCIGSSDSCPEGTVKTTLDKLIKQDSSFKNSYSGDATTVNV